MSIKKSKPSHPWRSDVQQARINSAAKGAAAEREFARLVFDLTGVKLERCLEQSRSGGHDLEPVGDDPAALAMRKFAVEVKRYRAISPSQLAGFWAQAEEQAAKASRMPVLAMREDRKPWAVLLPLNAIKPDFEPWEGIQWSAQVSVEAFCSLVREWANSPNAESQPGGIKTPASQSANKLREAAR